MLTCKKGSPLQLGVSTGREGVTFSVAIGEAKSCTLLLFQKNTKRIIHELQFTKEMITGSVAAMTVSGIRAEQYDYAYRMDDEVITDPYAKKIQENGEWGQLEEEPVTAAVACKRFDWGEDKAPEIPFHESILYRLHVRGFTKDKNSKVRHKGTFRGLIEKIPYIKSLGITMVELMPAYDFCEVMKSKETQLYSYNHDYGEDHSDYPVNFWGYAKGFYFAPKTAYAANRKDAPGEFKEMVKAFHASGIEVCMEFSFDFEENPMFILDCLRSWVLTYHIDGVHLFASDVVMRLIDADPILRKTKVFSWSLECLDGGRKTDEKHLASFNDGFMLTARKFLKGDEGQTGEMCRLLRYNPKYIASVNYIANHSTLTLMDLVSYNRKHNDANGENNGDGTDYNYSWNCGEEGPSKKRRVMELRKRQMKNALTFVMTAQGVPMLYAGDEYGNSQLGNNNPYCQDNEIGWVNWKNNAFNKEILEFTKKLIAFRKSHGILHMPDEMRMTDYMACGLPDMSYHGSTPWYSDYDYVNRHFAVMYCGKYAALDQTEDADYKQTEDLYIAYNMFWEPLTFGLPNPEEKRQWKFALATDEKMHSVEEINEEAKKRSVMVPPRSILILAAAKKDEKKDDIKPVKTVRNAKHAR